MAKKKNSRHKDAFVTDLRFQKKLGRWLWAFYKEYTNGRIEYVATGEALTRSAAYTAAFEARTRWERQKDDTLTLETS